MSAQVPWIIRPYRERDETAIVGLFNEVFAVGNPDFVPRQLDHWNYAFRDNPEGHHTFVAEVDGRLVGQYTAMPSRWRFPDGVALGAQAVDTCVAAEYRRSLKRTGLFLSLAYEWFDFHAKPDLDRIVWGLPNPQAFRIGTKRVDYRPVRCPVPERGLPLALAAEWHSPGIHVQRIPSFSTEVDAFDEELSRHHPFSCIRSARFLNWRYTDNPTEYHLLRAESASGDLVGFLVYTVGWHGDRKDLVPLVDYLLEPGQMEVWRALLGEAARHGLSEGKREFLTWAPPPHPYERDLTELGFDHEDSRFNLCIRIFTEAFDVPYAKENWYLNMGDSDIY